MKGLLIKDLLTVRKQAVWYAAMIVIFCIAGAATDSVAISGAIGILVTVSVPLTAMAYDETEGFTRFAAASGAGAKMRAAEKYILGVMFGAVSAAAHLAAFLFSAGPSGAGGWANYIMPVAMQFAVLAAALPVAFKYGVEKGRTYMIAIIVLMVALLVAVMGLADGAAEQVWNAVSWGFFGFSVLAAAVSYFISAHILSVKDL